MTLAQARLIALGVMAVAVVGVIVSKRASGDIAFMIIAVLAFSYFVASQGAEIIRKRRLRTERETPWTVFNEPHPIDPRKVEIGVRRRRDDGVVLDRRTLHTVDDWDSIEISVAEGDAEEKARRWTKNKVGM